MKKVLFLVPWLSGYGGTETVIHNLFKEYYKNKSQINFNFELYSLGGFLNNTNLHFKNVHVIQLFNNKFLRELIYVFLLPFLIPYVIYKENADLIISTNPILWTISKIFVRLFHLHIPIIAWYHYSFLAKDVKLFYLTKPDYFLTISKSGKNELIYKGINKNKIHVIYNPIIPSKHTIRNSKYHNKFIYVGRIEFSKQKNLRELFMALSKLRKPWTLCLYGKGDKVDIKKLKKLSYDLRIDKNIKWMGFKRNIFNKINIADALLLTSNYEGFPMVIAEAFSHGLYVISSNCPDGPSELINGENGCMYTPHNIIELSNLIYNIMDVHHSNNYEMIKQSINMLYIHHYFYRFINSLENIDNKER